MCFIRDFFDVGHVYRKKNATAWNVFKRDDERRLISLLSDWPPFGCKLIDFIRWRSFIEDSDEARKMHGSRWKHHFDWQPYDPAESHLAWYTCKYTHFRSDVQRDKLRQYLAEGRKRIREERKREMHGADGPQGTE
mmetsp:Transcript_30415/g.75519  ORF Transcript_30415/g.75519 Transcript_30415/m.75519 type:complete len:136 (-) Transcript_30415:45-452(-)